MKMQNTMPTEGQFVAVWEYNKEVWSSTYKWYGDHLMAFDDKSDDFNSPYESGSPSLNELKAFKATYLVR